LNFHFCDDPESLAALRPTGSR